MNDWRNFQKKFSPGNFYQSLEWGKFFQNKGGKFFLWQKKEGKTIKSGAIILKYILFRQVNYLYVPLGPIGEMSIECWEDFFETVKAIAENEGSFFIRFYADNLSYNLIKKYFIKQPPKNYFLSAGNIPLFNARLDLSDNEKNIFKNLHAKTRYNIRLAQRKGVVVKSFFKNDILNEFDNFLKLLLKTAQKKNFLIYDDVHYKSLIENFKENMVLLIAYSQQIPVATALFLKWDDIVYYLHGGTNFDFRHLMASHLLHWEAINFFRNLGLKFYDFGAISTIKMPIKKWEGITRFKMAFNAKPYILSQAYDLIINKPTYYLYNFFKKIKND